MHTDQYEANERLRARNTLEGYRTASLTHRQDARCAYKLALMHNPEIVAERLRWVLDGTHGMGPMLLAQEVAANRRMNRTAALAHLVAAFAWSCPANFATGAYKACSPEQRAAADAAINEVIAECDHLARLPLALGE